MEWRQRLARIDTWLALAVLVLLPVLSFAGLLAPNKTLYRYDLTSIHYPLFVYKARLLASGQVAFWNPHLLFGFPQVAGQDVLGLHPLNLLLLLPLKPHVALTLFVVFQYVLAGFLSYWLARTLRISRTGSLIAALAFALGGYMMAQPTNLPILTGAVWLPLILLLFVKGVQTGRLLYAFLCGGAIGLQILSSHPQPVFYSLFAVGAYGAWRLVRLGRDRKATRREKRKGISFLLSFLVIAALVAVFLAFVQIAATWELKSLSRRATGLSLYTMTTYSLPPYHLLTMLFPGILGNPVIGYVGEEVFEEYHAYMGIVPLMLSLWAWSTRKRDGHVTFFTLLAGVALLLALGGHTPLYRLLFYVPGFNFFRAPARWLFLVTFSLAVLAGFGFDTLADRGSEDRSRWFTVLWRALWYANAVLSVVFLAGLVSGERADALVSQVAHEMLSEPAAGRAALLANGLMRRPLLRLSDDLSAAVSSLNPALLYVLLSNAGFLLVYLWNRRRIPASAFQALVVALTAVDLLLTGGTSVNPVRDASYFERQFESTAFLRENAGLDRVFPPVYGDDVENLVDNIPIIYDLYSVRGHMSELAMERYKAFVLALPSNPALLNLAGVRYVLLDETPLYPGFARVPTASGPQIHENTAVLPRAFIVGRAEVIPSEPAVLARMLRDDFDPGETVILEQEPAQGASLAAHTPQSDLRGAEIKVYEPHRVLVEADLDADGFLVLSDTYYPGWRAYVDGQEAQIYRADYLFRAVFLEEGEHIVEFRYRPLFVRAGLGVYAVAGALVLGFGLLRILGRRRRADFSGEAAGR